MSSSEVAKAAFGAMAVAFWFLFAIFAIYIWVIGLVAAFTIHAALGIVGIFFPVIPYVLGAIAFAERWF